MAIVGRPALTPHGGHERLGRDRRLIRSSAPCAPRPCVHTGRDCCPRPVATRHPRRQRPRRVLARAIRQHLGVICASVEPPRSVRPVRLPPTHRRPATPCLGASLSSPTRSSRGGPGRSIHRRFESPNSPSRVSMNTGAPHAPLRRQGHQAFAILPTEAERGLLERRDDHDACGFRPQIVRNVLVRFAVDLAEHVGRGANSNGFLTRYLRTTATAPNDDEPPAPINERFITASSAFAGTKTPGDDAEVRR